MNQRNPITIVAALTIGAVFLATQTHAADFPKGSPDFVTSREAALKTAKESGKPVVMIFSAVWCGPCQANKKTVYPSAAVQPYHEKFVWVYLDADEQGNRPVMQRFGVTGIPHIQFLDKDGKSIGKAIGGTTPEAFATTLDATLKKAGS